MYVPDLAPFPFPGLDESRCVLAVGWLDAEHPFPTAPPSERFLRRLFAFSRVLVRGTRGFHLCEMCGGPVEMMQETRDGVTLHLGSAEVWIYGRRVAFRAPNLVYHYVVRHEYAPPEAFVNAACAWWQPLAQRRHRAPNLKELP